MDYPVPDFGVDQAILDSQKNEENAKKFLASHTPKPPAKETSIGELDLKLKKEAEVAIAKVVAGEDEKSAVKNDGDAKAEQKNEDKEEKKTEGK